MVKYRKKEYISITPTPDFQISHYKEREWVPCIVNDESRTQDEMFTIVKELFDLKSLQIGFQ